MCYLLTWKCTGKYVWWPGFELTALFSPEPWPDLVGGTWREGRGREWRKWKGKGGESERGRGKEVEV